VVAGDYRIEESVLIERKTASDFAQSPVTGRLFEQAARMAKSELARPIFLKGTQVIGRPSACVARHCKER
jgi:ERCC4-type nuclease